MKYIVIAKDGEELVFTCPNHPKITHKNFAESVRHIRIDEGRQSWSRQFARSEIVAAGFVNSAGICHGTSESLQVASRGQIDTDLLKSQYR